MNLTAIHKISGLPVIDGGKIIGIFTNRDLRFETYLDQPIKNIRHRVIDYHTVKEGESKEEVIRLLHHYRLGVVYGISGKPPAQLSGNK
jgi:IMP dehydrogenase